MLEPAEPGAPVLEWLSSLHLGLYGPALLRGGYRTLEACRRLTDGALLELKVFPTGHRRRILRSLEVLGGGLCVMDGWLDDSSAEALWCRW